MSFILENAKKTASTEGCTLIEALMAELVEVLWCVFTTKNSEPIADVLDGIAADVSQLR